MGRRQLRRRPAGRTAGRAGRGAGLRLRRIRRPGALRRGVRGCLDRRGIGPARPTGSRRRSTRRSGCQTEAGSLSALDRAKRPIDALTSNIGHCLWTGIVDEDKAASLAEHLLSDGDVQRMGHPHARHLHGGIQPDEMEAWGPTRELCIAKAVLGTSKPSSIPPPPTPSAPIDATSRLPATRDLLVAVLDEIIYLFEPQGWSLFTWSWSGNGDLEARFETIDATSLPLVGARQGCLAERTSRPDRPDGVLADLLRR